MCFGLVPPDPGHPETATLNQHPAYPAHEIVVVACPDNRLIDLAECIVEPGEPCDFALARLSFTDVARDLRSTDDVASLITDARDGNRDLNRTAVLAHPLRFEMTHHSAACDMVEDHRLFGMTFGRYQFEYRLADHLLGRIAEYLFGSGIPARDHAVQVLADDGIFGRSHDGCQTGRIARRCRPPPHFGSQHTHTQPRQQQQQQLPARRQRRHADVVHGRQCEVSNCQA